MDSKEVKKNIQYQGGCLCGETRYEVNGEASNPHLCSCIMCQKSSGAPTVAWVDFQVQDFKWTKEQPNLYQSSEKTQRCSCRNCGGLIGAIDKGSKSMGVTISSLDNPDLVAPNNKHSYKESAPSWWSANIKSNT